HRSLRPGHSFARNLCAVTGLFLVACSGHETAPTPATAADAGAAPTSSMAAWRASEPTPGSRYGAAWPQTSVTLVPGEGRDAVESVCAACHSLQYIAAQPPLSELTWQAEVTKMVDAFGAVVPPEAAPRIVRYLAAHYGEGRQAVAAPSADGVRVYAQTCVACHQLTGNGLPGAFPPLVGHAPKLAQRPEGRAYLPRLLLWGVMGPIQVAGTAYNNMMPGLAPRLTDDEIAAVLNHVLRSWGNDALATGVAPFTAADVAEQRKVSRTAQENLELRQKLGL
ncbi:MAG TPA: c-type cytochrome, partial [Myxococcota bacterium]|nr:c-type cytochrome [Myxococcota bacterium]